MFLSSRRVPRGVLSQPRIDKHVGGDCVRRDVPRVNIVDNAVDRLLGHLKCRSAIKHTGHV